ncbi:hypothetical protein Rsub_12212 [Raphidocelis subcapitata]|uniref:Uncharacterized protein n=1 Tax=Raphidocelis subcapitata TaxID=307507 RepID=A0A2V0PQ28_9CHLO|nr:hypothetical protein Rsub_12212 [Raphidocelis subcapitata]|eukprot:GBF99587.1 hypothetical protein Rsub_12212 [Raphidocelis subcapitata]
MERLRAAYEELVAALAAVVEASDRSAGDAVARLRAARAAVNDACDELEHRLVAAAHVAAAADAAAGGAANGRESEAAAGLEAFRARLQAP